MATKRRVKITLPGRLPNGPLVFTKEQWAKIKREQDGPDSAPPRSVEGQAASQPTDSVEAAEAYLRKKRAIEPLKLDYPQSPTLVVPDHEAGDVARPTVEPNKQDKPKLRTLLVPDHEAVAILAKASRVVELQKALDKFGPAPLTPEEGRSMLLHLRRARPFVARIAPAMYVDCIDEIVNEYRNKKGRGRPLDVRAFFASHMLAWGADPKNLSRQFTAKELMVTAIAVGLARPRRAGVDRLWITLHRRYSKV